MFKCKICGKEAQLESGKCLYCRMRAELVLWASTPEQARRIMRMPDAHVMFAMKKVSKAFSAVVNSTMESFVALSEGMLRVAKLLRRACEEALKDEEFAKIAKKYEIKGNEYKSLRSTAVRKNRVIVTGSQKSD